MNRREIIEKRLSMTDDEVLKRSKSAQSNLVSLECFKTAKSIMIYLPIQNEVGTDIIIEHSIDKKVFAPRVLSGFKMEAAELLQSTKKGAFGIDEPLGKAYYNDIDLYVVPGLFFSESGIRIGRGKGYYDRFLKDRKGIKIGLCYSFQISNQITAKETDVPMDFVVTDKGVF